MPIYKKNHRELRLPKIGHSMMEWQNLLANKASSLQFSLDQGLEDIEVRLLKNSHDIEDCPVGLLIEINGIPGSLWFSTWPFPERIQEIAGTRKISQLPVDLRAELVETALRPLLERIERLTDVRIRVLNFLNLKPSIINEQSLSLTLADKHRHLVNVLLMVHSKLLPVATQMLHNWPDHPNQLWESYAVPLWIEAGWVTITMKELAGLQVSDILLLEESDAIQKFKIRLRTGIGDYFRAAMQPDKLIIESGINNMSEEIENDAVSSIEDIPVRLTFDLGEVTMPFREIKALTEGYVVDLRKPILRAVTIRSHNKVIGAGELIEVDGNMGVRITRLFESNLPQSGG